MMMRANLSTISDADLYDYCLISLESVSNIARDSIRLIKIMRNRPILDADLAASAYKALTKLRLTLLPQTSSDYWYENFANLNGTVEAGELSDIASLVEERRTQIQFIDAILSRL